MLVLCTYEVHNLLLPLLSPMTPALKGRRGREGGSGDGRKIRLLGSHVNGERDLPRPTCSFRKRERREKEEQESWVLMRVAGWPGSYDKFPEWFGPLQHLPFFSRSFPPRFFCVCDFTAPFPSAPQPMVVVLPIHLPIHIHRLYLYSRKRRWLPPRRRLAFFSPVAKLAFPVLRGSERGGCFVWACAMGRGTGSAL